jgi:protein O-GlcNAc transferase
MSSSTNDRPSGGIPEDPKPLILQAIARHQQGEIDEAAAIYEKVLAQRPNNFDALHLLGVVALQRGRFVDAQRLINRALDFNAMEPAAVGNLGLSYMRNGQTELALHWFDIALKLQPDSAAAALNLATALDLSGRHAAAIPLLKQQCSAGDASYEAYNLLGLCLAKIGRTDEAVDAFEDAVAVQPGNPGGWANLAAALEISGQQARARDCATRAKGHRPEFGTESNRGGTAAQGAAGAEESAAIDTGPTVPMLVLSANLLLNNGLHEEAILQLRRALAKDEKNLLVRWIIAIAALKVVYRSDLEMSESRQVFSKSLGDIKVWYESLTEPLAAHVAVGAAQPFFLAYQPYNNRELLSRYGALCAAWMATIPRHESGAKPDEPDAEDRRHGDRLRLGIVSSHIREHSVWAAITKGWVQHLDRGKVDLYIFHLNETVDHETQEARRSAFHFENGQTTVSGWIDVITRSKLDALIYPEIGMDPTTLKLAALRLAPWQATSWGHPDTSGLPTIDAYLSAEAMEPPDASRNYTEALVRLPNLGVYCEPLAPEISDPNLASLNLPGDEPLLLCPGSPFKYAPMHDDVWVQIAKGLRKKLFRKNSGGRLVFFRSKAELQDRALELRLRSAFADGGVDFDARVSIIPFLDRARFFGLLRESALMLDTLGFSGFNTALQAAEGGIPMLTFDGDLLRGRLASGVMRRLELPELIAATKQEFIERALELVAAPRRLQELRQKIIDRREILFRDLTAVRALENYLIDEVPKARVRGT